MAKLFNVRMDDELREAIDAQAAEDGVSTSTWAREAMGAVLRLGGLQATALIMESVALNGAHGSHPSNRDSASPAPHPARSLALQAKPHDARMSTSCLHPTPARKRLPFSEVCGVCGATVRATA